MSQIVKVQRPMFSSSGNPPWLIYDEQRAKQSLIDATSIPSDVMKEMGNDYKGYFNAVWDDEDGWVLKGRVEDRDW